MGTFKVDGHIEGNYIKATWLYTSAATAVTSTNKIACIGNDNYIYYITPANLSVGYATSAGSANSVAWSNISSKPTTFTPAANSDNYIKVYNSSNISGSSTVTVNDLAKQGFAAAMLYASTDNPFGAAGWIHALSMAWGTGDNSNWISQLAFGVDKSDGMWYRTNESSCVGKAWKRVLDSSNYSSYALPISGGTIQSTAANTLSINTTNASTNYIRLANNNSNKVTLGYYLGLAFIANEVGNYARIGVNDSGVPQYWTTNTTSGGIYDLIHSGGGTMTGKLNYPSSVGGGVVWGGAFDHEPDLTQNCSMLATYMDSSSKWWNIISCRHRNGSSDGKSYGMYFKTPLTGSWAHLTWNRQYGNSWQGERTIHDTGNVCISSSNPGNGSFYGQIWFKI